MEDAARSSSSQVPPPPPRAKRPRRSSTTAAAQIDAREAVAIEAAARSSSSSQVPPRAKRPRRSSTASAAQIVGRLLPAVGIESAGSASRRARRRRRTAQIQIPPIRRAKTVRQQHLVGPVSSSNPPHSNWWVWGGRRPRSSSPRCLQDDDSNKLQPPPLPCRPDYHRGGEKRTRTWRDWSGLGDGPAGLIADRVLAYDVADYVSFRAVCRPWRQCSTDPRSHGGLDRRFHPWRWTILREELAVPDRRCFLNTYTGRCVQVDIPELHDHQLLAHTPEGLLVLVHDRKHIRLLNPLTRQLTELPPLTTLLPPRDHYRLLEQNPHFNSDFAAWGSGVADDDSTFVLCFGGLRMLGLAKPGDDNWTFLNYSCEGMTTAPIVFAGRFYCLNRNDLLVLNTDPDDTCLMVAANLKDINVSPFADTLHLVNNCGELMLVHHRTRPLPPGNESGRWYDTYQVDLDTGTLLPVKSLGAPGRAIFMGMYCSLSVSPQVFPSDSISADAIYLSFDFCERHLLNVGAYHIADGSIELPCSSVPRPHTLVDCLSLSYTVIDDS